MGNLQCCTNKPFENEVIGLCSATEIYFWSYKSQPGCPLEGDMFTEFKLLESHPIHLTALALNARTKFHFIIRVFLKVDHFANVARILLVEYTIESIV